MLNKIKIFLKSIFSVQHVDMVYSKGCVNSTIIIAEDNVTTKYEYDNEGKEKITIIDNKNESIKQN